MENMQTGPGKANEMQLNLSEAQFHSIRDEISDLVDCMRPSGSKNNVAEFGAAVSAIIQKQGVEPKLYWEDVWMKGGCKDVLDYNNTRKGPGAGAGVARGPVSLETHRSLVGTLEKLAAMGSLTQNKKESRFVQSVKRLFHGKKH